MKKEVLYSIRSPYRESLDVIGCKFGEGKKAMAVVGSMRGDEVQQMYICTQLIKELKRLEAAGQIKEGVEITVIPCINYYSMNIGKRFWTMDNTDINRMFPGYDLGETTQRIAEGVFSKLQGYEYGVQLASFYQTGNFLPHVKMMDTGFTDPALLKEFGFQYAIVRTPRPYDTTTLNYNWQIWGTKAFSLFAGGTYGIDDYDCQLAVMGILRFMDSMGIVRRKTGLGYNTEIVNEADVYQVRTQTGGIFRSAVKAGAFVRKGQVIGEIVNGIDGEVDSVITSECTGIVYFEYNKPLINNNTVCFKIIRD